MARSIEEILTQILEEKNSEPALSVLNSTSKVSIYRLYAFVIATVLHYHERTWDLFKIQLEKIAEEANVGTAKWLQRKVLEFQFGSTLTVINDTVTYTTIDETKRIISRCAVKENNQNRNILIKVAKDDSIGGLTKINQTETTALKAYVNQIKMAGTKMIITSLDADRLSVYADIYYDPAFLPDVVKSNIITAINNYTKSLDFSGSIYVSKITDVIQSVEGVKDVVVDSVKCRMASDDISAVVDVKRVYESYAGYLVTEDFSGYTLEDTLILKPFEE